MSEGAYKNSAMTTLDKIIVQKTKELKTLKQLAPPGELEKSRFFGRETLSLKDSITDPLKTGIIAEYKRKSPSKGDINTRSGVMEVTTGYSLYGASALSVLTDREFFGGSSGDLSVARDYNAIPVLRKDFIIDEYQVIESRAIGADAVLLIAAALERSKLINLARLAASLNLQVLLEVHDAGELEYINEFVDVIGVNNRNLKTFKVDTDLSFRLAPLIPENLVRISESGISSVRIVQNLKSAGYMGFLIGEIFMDSPDPSGAFRNFVRNMEEGS